MENKKKSPSWLAIILWFIFFWPVGVYLIWKKLTTDKSAAMKNSKVLKGIGYFFIFCAFIMFISVFDAGADVGSCIGGTLFYLVGGVLILWGAKRVKESGERYKQYIDIVINQQQYTIENIASQVGADYGRTVNELQEMIDKGYFANAYIDHAAHEIVFARKSDRSQAGDVTGEDVSVTTKVMRCPNCGGNNTIIVGRSCECDYCGSPIDWNR